MSEHDLREGSKPSVNTSTESEVERLRRELDQWTKWGVVEVAVRNPQVADYCQHWEGRAEKAEAENQRLAKERDEFANRNQANIMCLHNAEAKLGKMREALTLMASAPDGTDFRKMAFEAALAE